jgi:hypothetical protein
VKKLFPILFLLAACAADIPQDPAPDTNTIMVNFDPAAKPNAIVPLPNDLAISQVTGKIVVPPTLDNDGKMIDSPAQTEFNTSYLGTLDGFPYESTASVTVSGDLNPMTVNPKTVLAFDTGPATMPAAVPMAVNVAATFANKTITIPPPAGNWLKGHRYAIALIAGANGLRGAMNQEVIGSQTWTLVKSQFPLTECKGDQREIPKELSGTGAPLMTNCVPAVDIIPSTESDPQRKLDDQTGKALLLEKIRAGYDPILAALAKAGTPRADVPIVWTFAITSSSEMTFDPANSVIPFPNDAVTTASSLVTGASCGPDSKQRCVALPNPKTGKPLTKDDCNTTDNSILLVCGLNTLDGFSMIAPLISENSDKEDALEQHSAIDAKSLDAKSVGLARLQSLAPPAIAAIQTDPSWTPCLNCASSPKADGTPQTSPQQLQWKLNAPLDEHTTYAGYVTNGVKDSTGKPVIANPVFALTRSASSLLDNSKCPAAMPPATEPAPCKDSKSTVSLITDDQAKQLEPLRAGYKAVFDALEKGGVKRQDLALAFPFTTQSSSGFLDLLAVVPRQAQALRNLPSAPLPIVDATLAYQAAAGGVIPVDNVSKFYVAQILSPVLVTGPAGTLNTTPSGWKLLPVNVTIAVPKSMAPAGGYPVTIFGHGITRFRNDFLPLANALTGVGEVVVAADVIWHGDRTSCTGSKVFTGSASDDDSCADATTMMCDEGFQGLCVLKDTAQRMACTPNPPMDENGDLVCLTAGQGRCGADKKCQGPGVVAATGGAGLKLDASGKPEISGWNEFSLTNFFATRDNFRQQVVDLSNLVLILKSTVNTATQKSLEIQLETATGTAKVLDTTKIGYVGQSLGGILGTLFTSVSPDVHNVVLNVPGGALVQIILNAPSFATAKKALVDTLAASGIMPGSPGFDQFIGIAQWVLDEADPMAMGYRLTHPVSVNGAMAPPADRRAFIQFIEGDETVPNVSNFALVAGASRTFDPTMKPGLGCKPPLFCYQFTEKGDMFDATSAPTNKRHGFLLAPPSGAPGDPLTTKAQTQAATFLATGALP